MLCDVVLCGALCVLCLFCLAGVLVLIFWIAVLFCVRCVCACLCWVVLLCDCLLLCIVFVLVGIWVQVFIWILVRVRVRVWVCLSFGLVWFGVFVRVVVGVVFVRWRVVFVGACACCLL